MEQAHTLSLEPLRAIHALLVSNVMLLMTFLGSVPQDITQILATLTVFLALMVINASQAPPHPHLLNLSAQWVFNASPRRLPLTLFL